MAEKVKMCRRPVPFLRIARIIGTLALPFAAMAAPPVPNDPVGIVRAFYTGHLSAMAKTPALRALEDRDSAFNKGEVGCYEFDVTIAGQDTANFHLVRMLGSKILANGGMTVDVQYHNGDENPVNRYFFLRQNGKWLVDDIWIIKGALGGPVHYRQGFEACWRGYHPARQPGRRH